MSAKLISLISIGLVLSLASVTFGVVIGDFENDMGFWEVVGNPPPGTTATTSYSTIGATLNNNSLRISAGGGWNGAIRHMVINAGMVDEFRNNKVLMIDVTRLASEWTGEPEGGFSNLLLAINAGGPNWSLWYNCSEDAAWSPEEGDQTVTITYDYTGALPEIEFDNMWWLELFLITNYDPNYTTGGVYYIDNVRLIGDPFSYIPNPTDGANNLRTNPVLSWTPGDYADTHDVYLGTSFSDVSDVNRASLASYPNVTLTNVDVNSFVPGALEFNTIYYWRIDDVNGLDIWEGTVWSFKTGNYLIVEDFEDYNDYPPDRVFDTWEDYATNNSGATVGYLQPNFDAGEHYIETSTVHGGLQSMPLFYDHDGTVNEGTPYEQTGTEYYSQTDRTWDVPQDWMQRGIAALSIWFHGYRGYVGGVSYDSATGIYTMTGSGGDIYGTTDSFHFAYKQLSGEGSISARVDSISNTNEWAKAGVMIRNTLEADSAHAMIVVTPAQGVAFQYREMKSGGSTNVQQTGISAPHWVKITRSANTFIAQHSDDGNTWSDVQADLPSLVDITTMSANTYIGLVLTSHDMGQTGEAKFSDVKTEGNITPAGPFTQSQDVGIPINDAEQLYIILEDDDGNDKLVRPDPNSTQQYGWTELDIDLREFSDADVNLAAVRKMSIGVGNPEAQSPGGKGTLYFDDIRLYRPGCRLSKRSEDFAKADYAPAGDPAGDCVIDCLELEIMARDWLAHDEFIDPDVVKDLLAYYPLDEGEGVTTEDATGNGYDGTLIGGPQWIGEIGDAALQFDGVDDYVDLGDDPVFNPPGSFSISLWAYISDWSTEWGHAMISKRGEDGLGWQLRRYGPNAGICFTTRGIGRDDMPSETVPPINEWIHIAAVYDYDNETKAIYLDGVEDMIRTVPIGGTVAATDHNVYLGARANAGNTGTEALFTGVLDDVRFYTRALYLVEIEYLAGKSQGDGQLYSPVSSPAELYAGEPQGSRAVNFMDFAVLAKVWLEEFLWPEL